MSSFPHLLSPGRIGRVEIRNRIAMAPMGSNLGEADGTVGERLIRYYEARARGGVGLIIVGVGAIGHPAGVCIPNQVAISHDRFLPGLRELTRRAHNHGAQIAIQLQHGGKVARQDMEVGRPMWVPSIPPPAGGDLLNDLTPDEIQGVIGHLAKPGAAMRYHEMTGDDIAALIEMFASSAERAQRAGFDGVEIHAAHGYLLAEFLSAAGNHRTDEYGGSIENRARLLLEVIGSVRARVGPEFPVWCRLDGTEFHIPGGITLDDATRTAQLAVDAGCDAIHVSAYADPRSGAAFTDAPLVHEPGRYVPFAEAIKCEIDVPVIAVGRIDPPAADALIGEGRVDFVAMARKLLADPELPRKLAEQRAADVRPCIYGYTCVGNIYLNRHVSCAVNPSTGFEVDERPRPAEARRRVLVAGGGPAGMEVSRLAARRGHEVILCERSARLGGAFSVAAAVYDANRPLLGHLTAQMGELSIDVRMTTEVTRALVEELQPDVLVIATGARSPRPEIPGIELPHVLFGAHLADRILGGGGVGATIAIVGAGSLGLEIAEYCSRTSAVTVLDPGETLGVGMALPRRWRALHDLRERGATLLTGVRVDAVEDAGLVLSGAGGERAIRAETIVFADVRQPGSELVDVLAGCGAEVHVIGDCRNPGGIEAAFADAARLAMSI